MNTVQSSVVYKLRRRVYLNHVKGKGGRDGGRDREGRREGRKKTIAGQFQQKLCDPRPRLELQSGSLGLPVPT